MINSRTLTFISLSIFFSSITAAPTSSSLTARAGPGKRGLCWPFYNAPLDPAKLNDKKGSVNFIYDYETTAPSSSNGAGGLQFIGMQRCLDCESSPIGQLATRQKAQGWKTVFTLNEPDVNGITPPQAAAWYKQNVAPLPIQKGLPAVTSSTNANQGLDWLDQMLKACAGQCPHDFINLHHYGPNFAAFEAHVNDAHRRFPNEKIVVTEFALQNPPGGQKDQVAFYKQAFDFLDKAPFVTMYFPFVATSPSLFSKNDAAGTKFAGTGSTLFNDDKSVSAVGALMSS